MSSPVSYKLHSAPGNFRAFKALIAAEYNGVEVSVPDYDAAKVKSLSPTGKAPILEVSSGGASSTIFGSNAIARHLARIRRDTGLTGSSLEEEAEVDVWVDFATNAVEIPATVWVYPVVGSMPYNEAATAKAKADLSAALAILDGHLANNNLYLVGNQVTLADITVASALVYPMKLVCDKAYLRPHANVVRWFTDCVGQPEFKAVIGDVVMCKKEIMARQ